MWEVEETERARKKNRREMRSGEVGRRRMGIYMKWCDPLTFRVLGNCALCAMSVSSIIGFQWDANWASYVEYHGTVGLRLLSLDFSAPVFLWDIPIATKDPQLSWGLGP
jgi:hypothetical protein